MSSPKEKDQIHRLRSLIDIGLALASERELSRLIQILLEESLAVTQAEGASVYLMETSTTHNYKNVVSLQKKPMLRFMQSANRRIGNVERSGVLQVDSTSVAGHVAHTGETLKIRDCYKIPKSKPYKINKTFDEDFGYKTKSMLALPMVTADGKVRGVLQLINKLSKKGLKKLENNEKITDSDIISFTSLDEELLTVFASYAGIAIENNKLTESIQNLFESFVRASVKAIEARDPTTSGHSDRVAMMTVELALATHKVDDGPYKKASFSEEQIREIRYAALLHDFGKIGVTEPVLLKKKKLQDRELESILIRFDSLSAKEESQLWKSLCLNMVENLRVNSQNFDADLAFKQTMNQIETIRGRIKQMRSQVITANEPQVMSEDFDIDKLIEKIVQSNEFFGGKIVTPSEIKNLSIPRGSLTPEERKEIESHVSHTYEFLKQIAWTDDLSDITEIAHCHHEKMDGTGYPRGIEGEQIPIQARMMTIADIYDALTAFDRPYKKSLSPARALEILVKDARAGKIDGYLLKIFIEAGIFHHATIMTGRKKAG